MIIYAILLFLGFLICTTNYSNDLINLCLLSSAIIIPAYHIFKWVSKLLAPHIEAYLRKKEAAANKRKQLIIHIRAWLEKTEHEDANLLQFLDMKVNSEEFHLLKNHFNRKEKIQINEIYRKALLNPNMPITYYNDRKKKAQQDNEDNVVDLANEFIQVISNSVARLQKKWKLI